MAEKMICARAPARYEKMKARQTYKREAEAVIHRPTAEAPPPPADNSRVSLIFFCRPSAETVRPALWRLQRPTICRSGSVLYAKCCACGVSRTTTLFGLRSG